jgi:hypothetical protein
VLSGRFTRPGANVRVNSRRVDASNRRQTLVGGSPDLSTECKVLRCHGAVQLLVQPGLHRSGARWVQNVFMSI